MFAKSIDIIHPHEYSKLIFPSYPQRINFKKIQQQALTFALFLEKNRETIIAALINYETYHVASDEMERALDLFKNLQENKEYYKRRIGNIVTFIPRNRPNFWRQ